MKIKIIRKAKKSNYTIGKLYIDGEYFCDTLEDTDRGLDDSMPLTEIKNKKVYAETAIPTGNYKGILNSSIRFKKIMPLIQNVKGFSGIRIHSGNKPEHTEGCILVGFNKVKGQVINSRDTFNKLMNILPSDFDITII